MKIRFLLASVLMTFSVFGQNVPSYVPTNGLVGWWPFNGNANDESGNGNNGTVSGATLTSDRFGNLNSAYSFDGLNDFINVLSNSSLDNIGLATVNLWLKTLTVTNSQLFKKGNSSSVSSAEQISISLNGLNNPFRNGFDVKYNSNCISGSGWLGCTNIGSSLNDNNWHMITAVIGVDSLRYYVDGVILKSVAVPNASMDICNGGDVNFGKNWNNDPDYYDGLLDDIGFWSRPLTQQEITNLYNASLPSTSIPIFNCPGAFMSPQLASGLVGWWPFCGDADDESGNGNNGTVNGATLTSDRFGNANSAYEFNGLNNSINIPPSSSLDNFNNSISISAWIYNQGVSGSSSYGNQDLQGVFGPATYLVNDGGFFLRLYDTSYDSINDRSIQFAVGQPGGSIFSNTVMNVNNWEHVVATYDGGTIRLFRNSHLADSIVIGPGLTSSLNTAGRYYTIGQCIDWSAGSTLQAFNGILDDIGIWNRALDSSEVVQLYNTGLCTQTIAGSCDTLIFNANITGFNPVTYANQVKVYPNPALDNLVIDCGTTYTGLNGYSIRITNIMGQVVYSNPITTQVTNIQLNPPTWVNGTYVVQFINPNGTVMDTKRVIIQ